VRRGYLFQAGGKGHLFETLEIGPAGFRLLVPRRTLIIASGAAMVIAFTFVFQALISAMSEAGPIDASPTSWTVVRWIVVPMFVFASGPILFGHLAAKAWARIAVAWPRKVIPVEFRAVELRRVSHWIWIRAEGQETWLQVNSLRRRLQSALEAWGPLARSSASVG
jgi:hypothetical protein